MWTTTPVLRTTLFACAWALLGAQATAQSATTAPTLPELLQTDGFFCARQTPRNPFLCEFVLRITTTESRQGWVSYTSYVRAKDDLPDVKLRVSHPVTIVNGEVCIAANASALKIELFAAKDGKPQVRGDEMPLQKKAEELRAQFQLDDKRAMSCRGLTRSGHFLTFDKRPNVLRFVPLKEAGRLRLKAEKRGL